jgi:fibronectin type 3 domain-containing protein
VSNGTTYFYVVTADNSAGESADSAEASVTPDPTITTPAIPLGVAATGGNVQVSLTWSASSGASNYHVKRATTSGGPYTQVGAPGSAAYTDTSVANGTTYYYVVSALDSAGESANSAQVSALPAASAATPSVPSGLSATAGNGSVNLSWSPSSGATSYNVKRATTSGGPYSQVGAPTAAAYSDTSVSNGTHYYYVVSALDSAGESANSAQVSALPVASIPPVPSGLSATAGNDSVNLTWSSSNGAQSYHMKRATTSGGPYAQVGAPTTTSYADSGLTNGTAYYYVISAVNSAGESANSAQVNASPAAPTPPPTTFGTWTNVTPGNINLTDPLDCSNYGVTAVVADTANPGVLYTQANCQGIWKSSDYGQTWTGPINTGTNGKTAGDGAGSLALVPNSTAGGLPTLYLSNIRGGTYPATGFWVSTNGGVGWTNYQVNATPSRQDYYVPSVDPYNSKHLIMAGHEQNSLVQSFDGGHTWSAVNIAGGMMQSGGTAFIGFINTGNASTTANTWLYMPQATGGNIGTWRTTNGGTTWTHVDNNEHGHGPTQLYQPDTSGVVYSPGVYSALGWGVMRSTDYGQTWAHVGGTGQESVVVGTPSNVYALMGFPIGIGGVTGTNFELAAQPGTGTWVSPSTPGGLSQGPGGAIAVVYDGSHYILVSGMNNAGLWRYIEP